MITVSCFTLGPDLDADEAEDGDGIAECLLTELAPFPLWLFGAGICCLQQTCSEEL